MLHIREMATCITYSGLFLRQASLQIMTTRIVRAMKNHIAKTIRRIIFTTFQIQKGKLYLSPSRTDLISSLVGLFGSSVKTAFIIPSRQM